jgi:7,8-dihydropterin-6-yl-methyl-4-(beta-D-ribofuranosyl)aminobenzene 5'-phosphate synthase
MNKIQMRPGPLMLIALAALTVAAAGCTSGKDGCGGWLHTPDAAGATCSDQVGLTIVYDNRTSNDALRSDWGFACWVRYGDKIILFDTGADGQILMGNLDALGMDPVEIDLVVLSHIHGDHTGGLQALLDAGASPEVYLLRVFPTSFKDEVAGQATIHEIVGPQEIVPGVYTTGRMGSNIPEQALVLKARQGLVVITGCAHPGVSEMVREAKKVGDGDICLVLGGFHLSDAPSDRVRSIANQLKELGVYNIAPCHCTGDASIEILHTEFGDRFLEAGAGWGIGICP